MREGTNHRRRSIRFREYDYSRPGAYFVTIVSHQRECLFGEAEGVTVRLSETGTIVKETWEALPDRYPSLKNEFYMVMPNHIHGIIFIVGAGLALPDARPALGDIVRTFKSISAIRANRLLKRSGSPLWQRNYFEHIIRNLEELNHIRQYITFNPRQWDLDRENPVGAGLALPDNGARFNDGAQQAAPLQEDVADMFGGVRP